MVPQTVRRRAAIVQSVEELRSFYQGLGISPETTEKAIEAHLRSPLNGPGVRGERRPQRKQRAPARP